VEIVISKMHETLANDFCSLSESERSPDVGPECLIHDIEIDLSNVLNEFLHSSRFNRSVLCYIEDVEDSRVVNKD